MAKTFEIHVVVTAERLIGNVFLLTRDGRLFGPFVCRADALYWAASQDVAAYSTYEVAIEGSAVTRDELIAFEAEVADRFNRGEIRAPVHLDGGNEDQLIEVFRDIKASDWIFCSWRSHYKALLHGVPRDRVMAEILAGRSISLCFPEHRFLSSAIAGGTLPIALGVAGGIKNRGGDERVWCFLGDMVKRMGIYRECFSYACGRDLSITYVTEDNGKSVCTPTDDAWGRGVLDQTRWNRSRTFNYDLTWPHSGAGKRVEF